MKTSRSKLVSIDCDHHVAANSPLTIPTFPTVPTVPTHQFLCPFQQGSFDEQPRADDAHPRCTSSPLVRTSSQHPHSLPPFSPLSTTHVPCHLPSSNSHNTLSVRPLSPSTALYLHFPYNLVQLDQHVYPSTNVYLTLASQVSSNASWSSAHHNPM